MKRRIDILFPYPFDEAAPQRFRIEQYLPFLQENFNVKIYPFWSEKSWNILYTKGNKFRKIDGLVQGFLNRFLYLFVAMKADFIYIHREATPIGPPFIEWILAKVLRKKIIFDFDDAIWLPNQSEVNRGLVKNLKYHKKVGQICSWAYKVSVGNEFLAEYAMQFNDNVIVIPTTVDTTKMHNPEWFTKVENDVPIIGWTGTHSTLPHLDILWPVLDELIKEIPFTFHIISDSFPKETRHYVRHVDWNRDSEIQDLLRFDIGVMPLIEDEWAKGKCGFKLLQYMSLEIASIATDFGVNGEIIQNEDQGVLIKNNDSTDWKNGLKMLLQDPELRTTMGKSARKRALDAYSVEANKDKVLGLFTG